MDKNDVKIFVTYKDKHKIIKSDIITPIQTGRAIANEVFEDMIGDDTGDNISELNPYFCELTAMYWVWKHYDEIGAPDYIGFMHYRRHLSFNCDVKFKEDRFGLVHYPKMNNDYFNQFAIKNENIQAMVNKYDVIVANRYNVSNLGFKTCYDHYKHSSPKLHIEDYDFVLKYVKEKYPNFKTAIDKYNNSKYGYFTNIYIMKKDHFFKFCKWYFDILLNTYKGIENNLYTIQEIRQIGYISEWLFGIYITYLYDSDCCKIKELQRTFIDDTKPTENFLKPIFNEKQAICLSCDENYAPYLSVTLQSIITNSSRFKHYDIVVFATNISEQYVSKILKLIKSDNISIRFFNILNYMNTYDENIFKEFAHFSKAIYYRLFIPKVFKDYNLVCYLDIDIIITTDISEIFKVDLKNKYGAVVADTEATRLINTEKCWKEYFFKTLALPKTHYYFNSGVMVFNIQQCIKDAITDKAIDILSKDIKLKLPDQDVLNILFKNRLLYLDTKWNYEYHLSLYDKQYKEHLPYIVCKEYEKAKLKPLIIHYAGGIKPWFAPDVEFADVWWAYARKTPFYELILKRMMESVAWGAAGQIDNKSALVRNYRKNCLKYWKYKILRNFVFGKTRQRYITKKAILKDQIRQAKQFRK